MQITPHIKRIIHRNEGRKHSGCKAKRYSGAQSFKLAYDSDVSSSYLSTSITINSVTNTPRYFYRGADAVLTSTTVAWPGYGGYGYDIDHYYDDGSKDPTSGNPCVFDYDSDCVKFLSSAGGTANQVATGGAVASKNDYGAIDPESGNVFDFVFEIIFKPTGGQGGILKREAYAADSYGYHLRIHTDDKLIFRMLDQSANSVELSSDNVINDLSWYHVLVFGDRSANGCMFVNGVKNTSKSISAVGSTFGTDSHRFYINRPTFSGGGSDGQAGCIIKHVALWSSNAWLDTEAQYDFARERFANLIGVSAKYYDGTGDASVL